MQETQDIRVWSLFRKIPWRRKWQTTPIFLPRKSQGQRSMVGYSLWAHKRVGHDWATKQQKVESGSQNKNLTFFLSLCAELTFTSHRSPPHSQPFRPGSWGEMAVRHLSSEGHVERRCLRCCNSRWRPGGRVQKWCTWPCDLGAQLCSWAHPARTETLSAHMNTSSSPLEGF